MLCIAGQLNCSAQSTPAGEARSIFVIVHVDAMPQYAAAAASLLDSLRHDALWDKGIKNFKVLQEPSRTNHFTLVEEWADRISYDAFVSSEHTKQFREKIQPMLGSPFDERMHIEVKQ